MKAMFAAVAALSFVVPAHAKSSGGVVLVNPEFTDGFNTRGECQTALTKVRNDRREHPARRVKAYRSLSASAYEKESLRTTRCEFIEGRDRVIFYVNGIPGR